MRTIFSLSCWLIVTSLFSQNPLDSTAIRKVDSLIQISYAFYYKDDLDQAQKSLELAEAIALNQLGEESAAYGSCCSMRGKIFFEKRNYPEAQTWHQKAVDIRAKVLGKEDLNYAGSLFHLGNSYKEMGNFKSAEPLYTESIEIIEKKLGKENLYYGNVAYSLGILYEQTARFDKAEPLLLDALAVSEKKLGKDDPTYIISLIGLATNYRETAQFDKAEELNLEALSITARTRGKESLEYAEALISLALLYKLTGRYEESELFILEAKEIFEVRLKLRNHPSYPLCLIFLSGIYSDQGNYEKAKPLMFEALALQEEILGKDNPDYAYCLMDLGNLLQNLGNSSECEKMFLEASSIFEKVFGKEHPKYAWSIYCLAGYYLRVGNFDKAESCYLQAISIQTKVVGQDYPDYANSLSGLAQLYKVKGDYEKAEPLLYKALSVQEKTYGKTHSDHLASLKILTGLYVSMGDYEKAEPLFKDIASAGHLQISNALRHLSELEMQHQLNEFSYDLDQALNFAEITKGKRLAPLCFDNCLFYKGFLLNAAEQIKRLALSDSSTTQKFNTLKRYGRRLANQYALPMTERDSNLVLELEEKANGLEKDLVRTVAGFGTVMRQVSWQEVQTVLKPGEAAIEFVHYSAGPDSIVYAAMVLRPEDEQPQFIALFEQKQLQSLLKVNSGKARKADYVNTVYGFKAEVNKPQASKTLYEFLWKPLEKELTGSPAVDLPKAGIKTIYFSPSGLLHRLNLNAIPINEKETLSDRYHLVEVGSTRQLVISSESKNTNTNSGQALLIGGVQYDLNSDSIASKSIDLKSNITGTRGELNFSFTDSTNRVGRWKNLQWTDKEVADLEPILKSAQIRPAVLKGNAATEEAFKSFGSNGESPRILHIATHGYFFPDPKETTNRTLPNLGAEPVFKLSDHPMIRSGLILAGGNQAWKTGKPYQEGMEDGILTAYEISQMDLSNTELVVLSACETGLGDIQGNEGVYGLQRAFKIAGAKYLIMSLWQVPDFQTQELMTTFYTNWLPTAAEAKAGKTEKMSIPDAFRAAQQAMREKHGHPYFWAGFVLVE